MMAKKRAIIGPGAVKDLGQEIRAINKNRILIIPDKQVKGLPVVQYLINMLKGDGYNVSLCCDSRFNLTGIIDDRVYVNKQQMLMTLPAFSQNLSQMSLVSVITDTRRDLKVHVIIPQNIPDTVIVDVRKWKQRTYMI